MTPNDAKAPSGPCSCLCSRHHSPLIPSLCYSLYSLTHSPTHPSSFPPILKEVVIKESTTLGFRSLSSDQPIRVRPLPLLHRSDCSNSSQRDFSLPIPTHNFVPVSPPLLLAGRVFVAVRSDSRRVAPYIHPHIHSSHLQPHFIFTTQHCELLVVTSILTSILALDRLEQLNITPHHPLRKS